MAYCKRYDKKEDADCKQCGRDNSFKYDFCCLNECGEHSFCKGCMPVKVKHNISKG